MSCLTSFLGADAAGADGVLAGALKSSENRSFEGVGVAWSWGVCCWACGADIVDAAAAC